MKIPISRTSLSDSEISSVLGPLRSGWLVQGPQVQEFERKWSEFTGASNSVAVTSCTTGLHLSLAALGIGPGSEVIVPAFTWISSANVVEHLGAKVVFCDIDINTFNIDVIDAASKITSKTKAIMPVHLFGLAADMNPVMNLALANNLHVIEDSACGFGATYQGRHVGTFGNTGSFSFHPRKSITTGEGGMVTTEDDDLANRLRRLRDHGAALSDLARHNGAKPYLLPDFPDSGFNFRLTDIQGALGSAQLDRADWILGERKRLANRYHDAFGDLSWLGVPHAPLGYEHGYQSYACLFMPDQVVEAISQRDSNLIKQVGNRRDLWMEELQLLGVSTRPATHAVHMLGFYVNAYKHRSEDFFSAYAAYRCSVSLPLFHGMTEAEQDYVIESVLSRKP